jgi:hypothetical protein
LSRYISRCRLFKINPSISFHQQSLPHLPHGQDKGNTPAVVGSGLEEAEVVQIDRIDMSRRDEWTGNLDLELHRGLILRRRKGPTDRTEVDGVQWFLARASAGEPIAELQLADRWLALTPDANWGDGQLSIPGKDVLDPGGDSRNDLSDPSALAIFDGLFTIGC